MHRKSPVREQALQCILRFEIKASSDLRMPAHNGTRLTTGCQANVFTQWRKSETPYLLAQTPDSTRLNAERWEQVPVETFKTPQSFEDKTLANTASGFYLPTQKRWEQVPMPFSNAIHFLKVFENNLYVGVGSANSVWHSTEMKARISANPNAHHSSIFHSDDLGESWTEITPKGGSLFFTGSGMEFWVAGETLIAQGTEQFRSTDAGKTWTKLGVNTRALTGPNSRHIGVNGKIFYVVGTNGDLSNN